MAEGHGEEGCVEVLAEGSEGGLGFDAVEGGEVFSGRIIGWGGFACNCVGEGEG